MKVLVIPDVHLKPHMFHNADALMEQGVAERVVCLMDIPDDWNKQYNIDLYVDTFDAAIQFAKKYPNTLWCYGNHDLSYIWGELESGYSSMASWTVKEKLDELKRVLPSEKQLQYIHRIDDVIFCHGGVLDYFVETVASRKEYNDVNAVIAKINTLSNQSMWNDASPIWHRPQYSKGKMYKPRKLLQVVGHTPVEEISRSGNVISCDVFSTKPDGTPIGPQEYLLIDTETWEFEGVR